MPLFRVPAPLVTSREQSDLQKNARSVTQSFPGISLSCESLEKVDCPTFHYVCLLSREDATGIFFRQPPRDMTPTPHARHAALALQARPVLRAVRRLVHDRATHPGDVSQADVPGSVQHTALRLDPDRGRPPHGPLPLRDKAEKEERRRRRRKRREWWHRKPRDVAEFDVTCHTNNQVEQRTKPSIRP